MVGLVNIVLWVVFISISCGWFVVLIGMGVCSQSWIDLINVSLKLKMRMGYITNLYRTEHILEREMPFSYFVSMRIRLETRLKVLKVSRESTEVD